MKQAISCSKAPKALGPYSQAIRAGDFLYISGQFPFDADTGKMPEDVSAQALAALRNIDFILTEAGCTRGDLVKTTLFLADLQDFEAVNKAYAEFFEGTIPPARAAVQVARLPKDARLEIESVAYCGN